MNVKISIYGEYIATKEHNLEETGDPQKCNVFRKENSLGRQRLWGIKVMRRPGYDLKTVGRHEGFP